MLALILGACVPSVESPNRGGGKSTSSAEIRIFADSTMQDALNEIVKNYEASHSGSTVRLSFSNTKHLREVIEQGQAGDLLVSAIPSETAALIQGNYIKPTDKKEFATSQLVLAVSKGNTANIQSAQDMARGGVKVGMIADTAALGEQTRTVLANLNATYGADFTTSVMANVTASAEDAGALLNQLRSGEIDACIVNATDIVNMSDIASVEIPADANLYRHYEISILAGSQKYDQASDFLAYVLSPESQAILVKWGFTAGSETN